MTAAEPCPSEDDILGFTERTLSDRDREAVAAHLDACDDCRGLLVAMADGSAAHDPRHPEGRYALLTAIGAGGMGIVHAAFDRELGRRVALKFLAGTAEQDDRAQARLVREAKSLAQLAHPNVVTVFDVGVLDGEVFVAMELVEGESLRRWLASAPRTLAAKLDVLRQAGEGLAAAHAVGIVHRDFKPDNVLVGRDGRARVTDFGVARAMDADAEADEAPRGQSSAVTRTGVRAGTPASMAPEQKLGRAADARSDVYSYSVTLCEAVTGARPGAPGGRRAPRWLSRAIDRGLRQAPDDRWPSMQPLLCALTRGPLVTARRLATIAAVAALVLAVGVSFSYRDRSRALCGSETAWGAVFTAADEDAIRRAFAATGDTSAGFSFGVVKRGLDDYRSAWVAKHREACEATRVRGTQSEALLDRRMVCLEGRRRQVAALVSVFAEADPDIMARARAAIDALATVASCDATDPLTAMEAPPAAPDQRAELGRLEGELMRATAQREAVEWIRCRDVVRAMMPAVQTLGYRPLLARAKLVLGQCQSHTPPTAEGVPSLREAAHLALAARDDATLADAWITLVGVHGRLEFGDLDDDAGSAEAAIARLGGDDEREGQRLKWLGFALARKGKTAEAEVAARRSVALLAKVYGPDDYRFAHAEEGLAVLLVDEDRVEEAYAINLRVTAARARAFGPDSRTLQIALLNEGEDLDLLGRPVEGAVRLREAIARWDAFEQDLAAYAHCTLAVALRDAGKYGEALDEDLASLKWSERQHSKPVAAAPAVAGAGLDQLGLGHPSEAVALFERALDDNPLVDHAHFGLARALWDSGGDRLRARHEAEEARHAIEERAARYGGRFKREQDAIDAWLASHRGT